MVDASMSARSPPSPPSPPSSQAPVVVEDLLQQCHALLAELQEFKTFIEERKKEKIVEIRHFQSSVRSELKSLEKLSTADANAERTIHTLRSSNLPFYIAVWDAANSSAGISTFSKRFFWARPPWNAQRGKEWKRESVLVDIVAQGGLEWVKVSTVTETRLLFDLAKAGWEAADSLSSSSSSFSDDGGEDGDGVFLSTASSSSQPVLASTACGHHSPPPSHGDSIELVRLAVDLQRASRANLIRYQAPSIRFVLPKISPNPSPPIASILSQILATGANIECGPSSLPYPIPEGDSSTSPGPPPPFSPSFSSPDPNRFSSSGFEHLLPDPHASLTHTLNIDCTILLALISDLSHSPRIPHSPSHHQAITRQIALEVSDPLLPESLYPALEGHDLVCTAEAATRMREIVQQIGTKTERKRAWLLFGFESRDDNENGDFTDPSLTDHFAINALLAAQSEYAVPSSLQLPIRIIKFSTSDINMDDNHHQHLPSVAQAIATQLSPINQSVFLFGWQAGITTISSNRTVAKLIEGIISEANERSMTAAGAGARAGAGDDDDENDNNIIIQGPDIFLCSTARSLIGKEKVRRG